MIEELCKAGIYATLRRQIEHVDFSIRATKAPEVSVRRIVQDSPEIFKILYGLWALEKVLDAVLRKFELKPDNKKSGEVFTRGYYQGLLVEIGKLYGSMNDKSRLISTRWDIR